MQKIKELKPVSSCWGITNRTKDDQYVLFADFDRVYLHVLFERLKRLQERHKGLFSNFLILSSSEPVSTGNGVLGSFHAVSFGKMPYSKVLQILQELPVDPQFTKSLISTPYKTNTLRISPKYAWKDDGIDEKSVVIKDAPKFLCWFPTTEKVQPKKFSTAHLRAYYSTLGMPLPFKWKNMDGQTWIEVKKYDSAKG